MLVISILQLFGILVLSFLLTPFVLSLITIIFAVFVLTAMILTRLTVQQSLKAFPKVFKRFTRMKHDINKEHRTGNYEIPSPNHLHSMRVGIEKARYLQPVRNLQSRNYCEQPLDDLRLYVAKYPTIHFFSNKVNSTLKVVHKLILFYRSYYGLSTKVEKNPVITDIDTSFDRCYSEKSEHTK